MQYRTVMYICYKWKHNLFSEYPASCVCYVKKFEYFLSKNFDWWCGLHKYCFVRVCALVGIHHMGLPGAMLQATHTQGIMLGGLLQPIRRIIYQTKEKKM